MHELEKHTEILLHIGYNALLCVITEMLRILINMKRLITRR